MSAIYQSITELIGNTPLMALNKLCSKHNTYAKIIAKVEFFNPSGSIKDRAALAMIEAAEKEGLLKPCSTIIEPTSGNTGIGLAAIGAVKGYKVIITMPDTMSVERRKIISLFGAEIVLTEGALGMSGAIAKAEELAKTIPDAYIPYQFNNPANPETHRKNTATEIWCDTEGEVDIFVACVGSGGTLTGIAEYLKSKNENIQIVAVEPQGSAVLSGGKPGAHKIQGIGAGFVPENLNLNIIDEIVAVTDEEAIETTKELARVEGVFAGISSGAALFAALNLAKKEENSNKNIIVILPDTGERYLSNL